ncbi:MAG: type II toxin-antitoxin system RelE/ParE family toxin [Oscillospiraceae bacterium]|jgi:hypothetical protein|nr:type II toxin-antitoxin system RelE/ParE family toxin [Oscillospiraceae bacterium]
MPKTFIVLVRPQALEQFAGHIEFLARVSVKSAQGLEVLFNKAIDILEENAQLIPFWYEDYRKLTFSRYALIYQVFENTVVVRKILDMRTEEFNDLYLKAEDAE